MSTAEVEFGDLLGNASIDKTELAFIELLRFSQENAKKHGLTTGREAMILQRAYRAISKEIAEKVKEVEASLPKHSGPIKLA
mgnify:FL=1